MAKLYPNLLSPIKVGKLELKSRLQFSPMVCCLSSAYGEVTTDYVNFIEMQAKTGVGLITIGATSVDEETGIDFMGELNITRDDMIAGLSRIADAAHRHGAKISAEMCHAGRNADPYLLKTPYALAPSVLPGRAEWVKEMSVPEIKHVVNQYAECAERLMKAGFDMCMIHGAHGNIIGSFVSPVFNKRHDQYGGSFENRARFPLEIVQAIRERCGDGIAIEYRISADEIIPGGMRVDDTIKFLKIIEPYIDLVNCSRGLLVDPDYEYYAIPPYYNPFCHNVEYSEKMKAELNVPISVVGSIKNPNMAEEILANGQADMVSMARALLADPQMLHKAKAGHHDQIRPCLRCHAVCNMNTATGKPISCAVNPSLGNETRYDPIVPSPFPKKAVVVGGGPAGMMAVQTLRQRGHEVVLFEAADELGGRLPFINKLPFKEDLRMYTDWAVRTTMECGADIRLGTKATPELVAAENPDLLFLALGGTLIAPPVPGLGRGNVHSVIDVDTDTVEVGEEVVVCGGGVSGLECALGLGMKGKKVTVVDARKMDDLGSELFMPVRNMLLKLLRDHGVKIIAGHKVMSIEDDGVHIMDHDWRCQTIPCTDVVNALGVRPVRENVEAFEEVVPETYLIGDCAGAPLSIAHACFTAFHETVIW